MKIRKSQCYQKIPCIRFAENDISNYGLIFKTNSAREQNEIFIEKPYFFSRIRCVENETIVANIVSRKSYTRNLLVAFKFSNFHFYVQNCRFRALCCRFTANQAKIQKSTSNTIQPTYSHDRIIDLTKNTQKLSSPSVFIVFIYSLCQAPDHEYEDLSRAFFSKLSFCRKKTLNNEI